MTSVSATTNRIDERFIRLGESPALILYLTAGHPDFEASLRLAPLVAELADVIEIGVPFSDPVADGPIIQASTQQALRQGMRLDDSFKVALRTRAQCDTPIVFLTYYNPVLRHGLIRFADDAREAGVDGIICADLPVEEAGPFRDALVAKGMHFIPMVAPTSTNERLEISCHLARGFVYCVSRAGVTGLQEAVSDELPEFLMRVRSYTELPRAVGFGVSNAEHARAVSQLAEGVIIGSALVDLVAKTPANRVEQSVRSFVGAIREGMNAGA
jgi:tryptophan synthase alpha chain